MNEPFFDPGSLLPIGDDHECWVSLVDPTVEWVPERARWEARAAQWRARALAEAVFGSGVEARLSGIAAAGWWRGLLHLDVPFRALPEHREREARFLAAAARDAVLARVPLLFVFGPSRPAGRP